MRHHDQNRKLGRNKRQRTALLRSLALALIRSGRIKTTLARAKELRPFVEKLVSRGKRGDLHSRRAVVARLANRRPETKKLFEEIAPRYKERGGGYTRVNKLSPRRGDASPMAIIEFV